MALPAVTPSRTKRTYKVADTQEKIPQTKLKPITHPHSKTQDKIISFNENNKEPTTIISAHHKVQAYKTTERKDIPPRIRIARLKVNLFSDLKIMYSEDIIDVGKEIGDQNFMARQAATPEKEKEEEEVEFVKCFTKL